MTTEEDSIGSDRIKSIQDTNKIITITIIALSIGLILSTLSLTGRINSQESGLLASIGGGIVVGSIFLLLTELYFKKILGTKDININNLLDKNQNFDGQIRSLKERLGSSVEEGIKVHSHLSDIDVGGLISKARKEVLIFMVSARYLMTPQIKDIILGKVKDGNDPCKFRILLLNTWGGLEFANARNDMMDVSPQRDYYADIDAAKNSIAEITEQDPTHSKIDVRFYSLMPTTAFFVTDNKLFITFLLTRPIAHCPVIEIDIDKHQKNSQVFINHFNYYWKNSKFFVVIIGFNQRDDKFIMVLNKKRNCWEWPRGYIEPNEKPEKTAEREFEEETGYAIKDIKKLEETLLGLFYCGIIGEKIHGKSSREVKKVRYYKSLPQNISFDNEREDFEKILKEAKERIGIEDRT